MFGFEHVQLNRIEAYVSPSNSGSIKVLEKNGFYQEGLLRKLLYINGKWQDHYIYASLTEYEEFNKLKTHLFMI